MFSNLTKEIFYYSVIPVAVMALIIIILLLIGKKKNNNYYKYNYSIKVVLSILIAFILSIMAGYTIWFYERAKGLGTLANNILYLLVLLVIVIALLLSLCIMTYKLYKSYSYKDEKKELPQ